MHTVMNTNTIEKANPRVHQQINTKTPSYTKIYANCYKMCYVTVNVCTTCGATKEGRITVCRNMAKPTGKRLCVADNLIENAHTVEEGFGFSHAIVELSVSKNNCEQTPRYTVAIANIIEKDYVDMLCDTCVKMNFEPEEDGDGYDS